MGHTTREYLFISVSYGKLKRGAYTVSERICHEYAPFFKHLETNQIEDVLHLKELNKKYKLIFITQEQTNYSFPLNIITLQNLDYILYSRTNSKVLNVCNNGFYYSKERSFPLYIPLITDFKIDKINESKRPVLGFYIRNYLTPDSYQYFLNLLDSLRVDVDVYTMGQADQDLSAIYKHVHTHTHTYDNTIFFSKITHYIYPRSKHYRDPLPHTLIEAVQNNIQIVIPTIEGRDHKDGIDDIIEVSRHHTSFNLNKELDNTDTIFRANIFKPFYTQLIENGFTYDCDLDKYKSYTDWLRDQIL